MGSARDTWSYGAVHPARVGVFGTPCPGSAGTPALAVAAGALPWLGDRLTLEATPAGALASPGVVVFGDSRSSWLGQALPFDLTSAGMPGCMLRSSILFGIAWSPSRFTTPVPLVLPVDPALSGATVHAQALVLDHEANPPGLTTTNGLELRLGSR